MSHIATFLNTKVENTGVLSDLGNFGLTPVRYLFGGQTMRYSPATGSVSIPLFHPEGAQNQLRSAGSYFVSSETGMIKTALAIICLVPGIFLAIFKMLSYIFPDVRRSHRLAQQFITPVDWGVVSANQLIASQVRITFTIDDAIEQVRPPMNSSLEGYVSISDNPESRDHSGLGLLGTPTRGGTLSLRLRLCFEL